MMNVDNLKELGFKLAAYFVINKEQVEPVFLPQADNNTPGVYFWVQRYPDDTSEIVYIGKYGNTVRKRLKEHMGGFKYSQSGKNKVHYMVEGLYQRSYFEVYSKPSHSQAVVFTNVLGEADATVLSTNAVDEITMLNAFYEEYGKKPLMNKTKGG